MNETRMLSEYLAELRYGDLPAEVIHKAKRLILDYLGYSMAAVGEPTAEILVKFVKQFGKAPEESTVVGYGFKTHSVNAALVNGAMGHIREMDDTDTSTMSHPGDSIIAAGLAVAEKEGITGKDFLTAIVAGYEAALRIGAAIMPSHYAKGWHTTGTFCTFGAAVSAGKALGFDTAQIENTLGLAGVQTSGMFGPGVLGHSQSREIFMTKDLRPGKAAMNGVMSALLTQMGFTGNPGILETDRGFCALYSDYYDLARVVEGLGKEFKIMKVAHKPYSACRYIHGAIDATLELVDKYRITKDNVDRITVTGYKYVALGMDNPDPKGFYGPRFSMQFQVALAILEGREGLRKNMIDRHYGFQKLKDPQMRELMKKIKLAYNKDLDKEWPRHWTTIVQVETIDGKVHTCRVDLPKGEPENDITDEELSDKVRDIASQVISKSQVNQMIDIIYQLEEVQNIRELTKLLIP
jgi:2-methylcitrate dehydratase PrpD